jgi:hypothetical protein
MEMMTKTIGRVTLCAAILFGAALNGQTTAPATQSADSDVAKLKAILAEQQKQIDALKAAMEEQKKLIERTARAATEGQDTFALPRNKALGDVASTTPIIPPIAPVVAPVVNRGQAAAGGGNPCEAPLDTNSVPPYLRLGSVCIAPVGFMDATYYWRDKAANSQIGSNFGSVPYNNVVGGKISEDRFSIQNSRLGFRADGDWKGVHFIGYNEFDFLGSGAGTNYSVTNGAVVPRIRLYWVDVRKGGWEFLAGQSWSMLTPNRKGISPLPGDIFYSQVFDVNYMAGLTWTRQPGMRVLYHFDDKLVWGFAAENPEQYIGGSAGGSAIALPTAFASLTPTQLDQANINNGTPTLTPDFISKIAWDPSSRFHAEVGGILSTYHIVNPNNLSAGQYTTKAGGGVLFGINAEVFKNFRLITTNFWSDGDGRYLFGQAPDLVVTAKGDLSLMHSGGTVDGFELKTGKFLWYAYYGGIYIDKNVQIDTTGKPVGYGYVGSSNGQNKAIQEITFGFNETIWGGARYGAVNFMGQYEYLTRNPWYIGTGPKDAHDNTLYFDVRYTLPGSIPAF